MRLCACLALLALALKLLTLQGGLLLGELFGAARLEFGIIAGIEFHLLAFDVQNVLHGAVQEFAIMRDQ